jgi:type IX secretion system PorP/SprF family membrane protein
MTYGVSYDRFYVDQNSGLGVNLINDMQALGTLNWLTLDVMYSYNVRVAYNAQIRGGIQAGGILKSQNTRNLIFPDMVDPSTGQVVGTPGFEGKSRVMPDFAVGLLGEWGIFYGGIAVHHLLQPVDSRIVETTTRLPRKYTVHIGSDINIYKRYLIRKSLILSPNIIYQQQSNFKQLSIGVYLSHLNIVGGFWVKNSFGTSSSTFVFMAGYDDVGYSFAYSYDFSILKGGFRGLNTSSHEVTFGMNLEYKKWSRKKVHTIKSPKF